MRYIESFFLGILIACTALFIQVFLSIFTEVLLDYDLTLEQSATFGFFGVLVFFLINATVEEALRYTVIKKRILSYIQKTTKSIIFHGILFGAGFWIFEITLVYFRNQSLLDLLSSISFVFVIHVLLSIFFIFFITRKNSLSDIFVIITAILLHTLSNSILYIITI